MKAAVLKSTNTELISTSAHCSVTLDYCRNATQSVHVFASNRQQGFTSCIWMLTVTTICTCHWQDKLLPPTQRKTLQQFTILAVCRRHNSQTDCCRQKKAIRAQCSKAPRMYCASMTCHVSARCISQMRC